LALLEKTKSINRRGLRYISLRARSTYLQRITLCPLLISACSAVKKAFFNNNSQFFGITLSLDFFISHADSSYYVFSFNTFCHGYFPPN
jgi:hypothetical protein